MTNAICLFKSTLMQISNQPVSWQCIFKHKHGQDDLLKFKLSIRMGEKGDLNDFGRGMFVGAKWAGGSSLLQKLLIYWDFGAQPSLGLLMSEENALIGTS